MTEISTMLLIFLIEALVATVLVILIWSILVYRQKKKDRKAVNQLVEQIKQQSKTRLQITSSFLEEKYRFEGAGLKKAVAAIDKGEKKFMQKLINTYLNRDSHGLTVMDASMAELIEVYKQLTPIMPELEPVELAEPSEPEDSEEVTLLRLSNASLVEELTASRQSMADMLEEFGNMFGGGKKHEMERNEVMDKLKKYKAEHEDSERFGDSRELDVQLDEEVAKDVKEKVKDESAKKGEPKLKSKDKGAELDSAPDSVTRIAPPAKSEQPVVAENVELEDVDEVNQDEIDALLNSIDLSDDDKK
ncbi:MAG: hypothetical protein ISR73_11735 [Gammaproteobacteria bacterium]|nr:hypothetical protein [Gammaproteobacteria bacterium]